MAPRAPIAEAAARAGRHVFVEKPMCFSAAEGQAMVAAAEAAGVVLMVGYPKRYDPAFARMREETARLDDARLLRVTTFESPFRPYVGHYPLLAFPSPFLRNQPATLEIESGTGGTGRSWRTEEITGFESGFKNELAAFHDSIVTGRPPPTSGRDGLRDITLCQAIIDSHHRSAPVDRPSEAGGAGG